MNSDQVAEGILKAVLVFAIGWVALTFISRNEWVLYLGIALFVAGSIVVGIALSIRDTAREVYASFRRWGWPGLALRIATGIFVMASAAGGISALLGLLWLSGPDKDSSPMMILAGAGTIVASRAAVMWCERRMKAS